ncbi:MAG TPA: hypothetical protein VHI75_06765 [Casimicrobiaceae bacterium]|nr:hypothetical protein [Casimicrobiaceae bacterium]
MKFGKLITVAACGCAGKTIARASIQPDSVAGFIRAPLSMSSLSGLAMRPVALPEYTGNRGGETAAIARNGAMSIRRRSSERLRGGAGSVMAPSDPDARLLDFDVGVLDHFASLIFSLRMNFAELDCFV